VWCSVLVAINRDLFAGSSLGAACAGQSQDGQQQRLETGDIGKSWFNFLRGTKWGVKQSHGNGQQRAIVIRGRAVVKRKTGDSAI